VVCVVISVALADTVGDRVLHTVLKNSAFPLVITDALFSGNWVRAGGCVSGRGVPVVDKNGVSKGAPLVVYYQQSSGYISGFSLRRWDQNKANSNADQFWEVPKVNASCSGNNYCVDITVIFRDPKQVCNSSTTELSVSSSSSVASIGDRIVVGAKGMVVPLTSAAAKSAGWLEGNCIPHMGIHYSYIYGRSGTNGPWSIANLFPIQPMYDSSSGHINALLVQNPHATTHVTPFGAWEGPFINLLMCKNWCKNTSCGFKDTKIWTTMHFFFRDPSNINCNGARCSI